MDVLVCATQVPFMSGGLELMVDNLAAVGQEAQVEEFKSESGKELFRVRGGAYTEEQARQQRDKLSEQQFKAFIVNSQ